MDSTTRAGAMEIAKTNWTTGWSKLCATGMPALRLHRGWRGARAAPSTCTLCSGYVEEKGNQLHDKLEEDGEEGCLTVQGEGQGWKGGGKPLS